MGQIHMYCTLPTFENIKLGWTVSGEMSSRPSNNSLQAAIIKNPTDRSDDDTLAAIVRQFWETGDFGSEKSRKTCDTNNCSRKTTTKWNNF